MATLAALSTLVPAVAQAPPLKPLPGSKPCSYPAEAQRSFIAGPVLFTAQVQSDGTVRSVDIRQVPKEQLGFEEAIRACVSAWRFEPAAGQEGLRQYEGRLLYRVAAGEEEAIRALIEAFASAWNAKTPETIRALQGTAQHGEVAVPGSPPSLTEQFTQERAAADWNMALASDFQQIRFLRPDAAFVRQPFRRETSAGVGSPAGGQVSFLEATAIKRGDSWTLLGWYPIAGPPSLRSWAFPGIEQPRKLKSPVPRYPSSALETRMSALVILEGVISPQGKVTDLIVLRGHPLFDNAAVDAVRKWEFAPALQGGIPIPVAMTVTLFFEMRRRSVTATESFALVR